jgi:hypothetical protein
MRVEGLCTRFSRARAQLLRTLVDRRLESTLRITGPFFRMFIGMGLSFSCIRLGTTVVLISSNRKCYFESRVGCYQQAIEKIAISSISSKFTRILRHHWRRRLGDYTCLSAVRPTGTWLRSLTLPSATTAAAFCFNFSCFLAAQRCDFA